MALGVLLFLPLNVFAFLRLRRYLSETQHKKSGERETERRRQYSYSFSLINGL
jgi:hypothetical protein